MLSWNWNKSALDIGWKYKRRHKERFIAPWYSPHARRGASAADGTSAAEGVFVQANMFGGMLAPLYYTTSLCARSYNMRRNGAWRRRHLLAHRHKHTAKCILVVKCIAAAAGIACLSSCRHRLYGNGRLLLMHPHNKGTIMENYYWCLMILDSYKNGYKFYYIILIKLFLYIYFWS